jgi:hypothetical protein
MLDKQRVFDEALQRMRVTKGRGVALLTDLRDAFARMKLELDGLGANDAHRDAFVDAIARVVDDEPTLAADERAALRGALQSAFQKIPLPKTTVLAVKCEFLARVRFENPETIG